MNSVNLMGRITKDLEIENYGDTNVLKFNIAINRMGKKDEVDFIPCTAFNKTAENIKKFFGRGNLIGITGRLQVNQFKDKDGNNRTSTTVIVESFSFCGEAKKETLEKAPNIEEALQQYDETDLPF